MKLSIFDRVSIVHVWAMAIQCFCIDHDVSSRSHLLKTMCHSFSNLSSLESVSIPCTGSIGLYK